MTESEIVELIRRRDENGARELLLRYGALMRYIISPILPNAHDCEDCLSEAAMRVWEKIEQFNPDRGSFKSWLTQLTRRAALNYLRGRGEDGTEIPEGTASNLPSPEEALLRRERTLALERAVSTLTERERLIFYRKYYYLQPTAQIAAELGLSERAVEGRLYRIKAKLKEHMGGEGYE